MAWLYTCRLAYCSLGVGGQGTRRRDGARFNQITDLSQRRGGRCDQDHEREQRDFSHISSKQRLRIIPLEYGLLTLSVYRLCDGRVSHTFSTSLR